jgi:aminopeptidase N
MIEGNTTTPFTEVKYVTLEILEMSKDEAQSSLNKSLDILNKMNSSGFYLNDVQKLLSSMNDNYASLKFNELRDLNKQINDIYTAATESEKLIKELNQSIIEAEKNGVSVVETKKLLYLAQIIFERGDYVAAYAKLKEAKSSFLLETKGEFNLWYNIKNNPVQSLGIFISLSLVGIGSGY